MNTSSTPRALLVATALLLQVGCTGKVQELATPGAGPGQTGTGGAPGMAGAEPLAPAPLLCTDLGSTGAPVPLRRLTATQVQRTVRDVLGVSDTLAVSDERIKTYRSNVSTSIDGTGARGYYDFAERVAQKVDLARCGSAGCASWLLDDVGLRLFRRPLGDEQRARYQTLFTQGGSDGARWVLSAMLQSPSFLYLDELARADGYLDDYGIAARLALVLWGQNPDRALLDTAAVGGLATPEAIRAQLADMLADPRSEGGLSDFVDQWLELHRLDDADARPDLAELGKDVLSALRAEPVARVQTLLVQGGGLRELLTQAETVAQPALLTLYGADVLRSEGDSVQLDPERRPGILALPGVMAAHAHAGATSPTLRGYNVLAHFLCTPPPPPPAGVSVTLPEVGPDATPRERLEVHFSDATCGACHRTMDGLGFAFESIDWLGRTRDDERGRPIDDRSTFRLGGEEVTVDGVAQLASTMADSQAVADCVAKQWARYATGVEENGDGACLMKALGEQIATQDGLKQMMTTYLTSDWFRRARGDL